MTKAYWFDQNLEILIVFEEEGCNRLATNRIPTALQQKYSPDTVSDKIKTIQYQMRFAPHSSNLWYYFLMYRLGAVLQKYRAIKPSRLITFINQLKLKTRSAIVSRSLDNDENKVLDYDLKQNKANSTSSQPAVLPRVYFNYSYDSAISIS